ncbi:class IV adenylate cyclase [Peptoniphilus catoniae]|uniref:class IV adenylate cyclase n=1 Tax=Peptoniphilus catoniae TaxID=1660341 RepID=UPI0015D58DD2|nr:class IV adenylate cyclase [Peptoniphilus catoniae]
MEKEVEVKLLGLDNKDIEEKLVNLGAELIGKEEQENIIIDSSINPIDPKAKGYLRIRTTKNLLTGEKTIFFTFKKHISDKEVRENIEYNTIVNKKDDLIQTLKALGYDKYDTGYKERTSYIYKNMKFEFDSWDKETYPFPYIEVEFRCKEDLYDVLNKLNVDKRAISTKSIAELKKIYKNSIS